MERATVIMHAKAAYRLLMTRGINDTQHGVGEFVGKVWEYCSGPWLVRLNANGSLIKAERLI
jgi:hypothetical protein